jgi:lysophospholipase L1-like esterase
VTDAHQRRSSCSFTVTVTAVPRIGATRYVAFGDSMTEGKLGPASYVGDPRFPYSYPAVLHQLLSARYSSQVIDMFDRGLGGELAVEGVLRLPNVLKADAPEVLLLLDGANDLNEGGRTAIPAIVSALRTMVRLARSAGIRVFLATLLPQRAGTSRARDPSSIAPLNEQIRSMATSEGAILVDLHQALGGTPDPWIDADGLHPTVAGYQKIAETFFEALRSNLELPSVAQAARRPIPHMPRVRWNERFSDCWHASWR